MMIAHCFGRSRRPSERHRRKWRRAVAVSETIDARITEVQQALWALGEDGRTIKTAASSDDFYRQVDAVAQTKADMRKLDATIMKFETACQTYLNENPIQARVQTGRK